MELAVEDRMRGLEAKVDRVDATLQRLEAKLTDLTFTSAKAIDLQKMQVDLAEVKGRISSLPTWWMLMVTVLSTWLAGAGIVFTLARATHP